ncbi:MAG: hypothetical protein ACRDID_01260 [Ktedonobacterales bacterium]
MNHYVFENAAPQAAERFQNLATLHDPATIQHLEALGVRDGWACWEVGEEAGARLPRGLRDVWARAGMSW